MQIAVIGSGAESCGHAQEVGRLLAERGHVVVCGGLGEVMEAAARGAKEAGGTTLGILPGVNPADANRWIDHVVATGTGPARNLAVVASCAAAVAVGGRWGTASEIAYARLLGRPVVALGAGPAVEGDGVERAETPTEAVELVLGLVGAA
ncbi:MAG: TIGR00725 family protein [Gaiellaceae bacterium]